MLQIDRRAFIAGLGGAAAVGLMSHQAKADALEVALKEQIAGAPCGPVSAAEKFPSVADLEAKVAVRALRRGTGFLFYSDEANANDQDNTRYQAGDKVSLLPKLPAQPTVVDFFALRWNKEREHCLQSANKAMERGADEEIILACVLHDTSQELIRTHHAEWGAQMYAPYVSPRIAFAIRYHQALRFYADPEAGYEYPDLYKYVFGHDFVPDEYIKAMYDYARGHRWYDASREVSVCDLYAFDPNVKVSIEPFLDIIGRHFKQPKEGLGNDNSAVAHMWRAMRDPDSPL